MSKNTGKIVQVIGPVVDVAFENGEIVAASWDMGTDISATVKDMVDKGVEVFNNSWGYNAVDGWNAGNAEELANTSDAEAYAYAAKNGAVWVQATGNDGYHDAAIHAGLGNVDLSQYGYDGPGEYEAPFLAVAALDYSTKDASAPSGYLAGYSNWCGSASGTERMLSQRAPLPKGLWMKAERPWLRRQWREAWLC